MWSLEIFARFEATAYDLGFEHAAVGAMVRSSYHADEQAQAAESTERRLPGIRQHAPAWADRHAPCHCRVPWQQGRSRRETFEASGTP